jgi:uncharacterized protein (DUF885 family)
VSDHELPSTPGSLAALLALPLVAGCGALSRVGYELSQRGEVSQAPVDRFDRFLDEVQLARLDRDPGLRSQVGLAPRPGWPDPTGRRQAVDAALTRRERSRLAKFPPSSLDDARRMTRRVAEYEVERRLLRLRWASHAYLAVPGEGPTAELASRLTSEGPWSSADDAEAWVSAVRTAGPWLDAQTEALEARAGQGKLAPRRALELVAEEARSLLEGHPLDHDALSDSALLAHFRRQLQALGEAAPEVSAELREELLFRATGVLREDLGPALARWLARVEALAASSPEDRGVWSLPDGEAWYADLLLDQTSLALSPSTLRALALEEVARLQDELRAYQQQVDHRGNLAGFFALLREDPRLQVEDDEAGRATLAARAQRVIEGLPLLAAKVLPRTPPVELDAAALLAGEPALYRVSARVYRQGSPGAAQRQAWLASRAHLNDFRRTLDIPVWSAGWDLYAATLAVELRLIEDPYDAVGVLVEELWAAALLVADTGLHQERWTPDRARDWLLANTPEDLATVTAAVDRLLTHPGTSAAAPIGCLRLRELRLECRLRLGARFDLARFHAQVLNAGPVPLDVLEQRLRAWTPRP